MEKRKFLPTFSDLIDRLTIHQLKEVFIPENKEKYKKEMKDIQHDLDLIIKENNIQISAELIRSIIVLAQMNCHIWYNETRARKGETQDISLLKLTHGLNGLRNKACNFILDIIEDGERKDWKTDCLAEEFKEWEVSLFIENEKDDENQQEI